ncbi:hypothetical protein EBB07_31045 [Paenibacillaceae bacterium]|nr:hypothetical protein EBB07_31045 [Paenibacillaceae bacterium]
MPKNCPRPLCGDHQVGSRAETVSAEIVALYDQIDIVGELLFQLFLLYVRKQTAKFGSRKSLQFEIESSINGY